MRSFLKVPSFFLDPRYERLFLMWQSDDWICFGNKSSLALSGDRSVLYFPCSYSSPFGHWHSYIWNMKISNILRIFVPKKLHAAIPWFSFQLLSILDKCLRGTLPLSFWPNLGFESWKIKRLREGILFTSLHIFVNKIRLNSLKKYLKL